VNSEVFLVTGANGDIGEAIGRILHERYPGSRVLGADSSGAWPGAAIFQDVYDLPRASEDSYIRALSDLAARIGATVIIPTSVPELLRLAECQGDLASLPLLMNSAALIKLFSDKLETARWLVARDLPTPLTMPLALAAPSQLPLIVKPRSGWGSRDIEIVRTERRLALVKDERRDDAIAQPLVGSDDAEFTCAMFRHSDTARWLTMRRTLAGGTTQSIRVEGRADIDAVLSKIAAQVPFHVLNVQMRLTDKGPTIIEINPRFSGTVMMRHLVGFEDVVWSVEALRGRPLPAYDPPRAKRVFRLSREVVAPAC
jgi:carbamoyl-phosphate synthase large subunit